MELAAFKGSGSQKLKNVPESHAKLDKEGRKNRKRKVDFILPGEKKEPDEVKKRRYARTKVRKIQNKVFASLAYLH